MSPLSIPNSILDEARRFFEDRGSQGFEGTAMITAGPDGIARRVIVPDQTAAAAPHCRVEVSRAGKLQLAAALAPDERYVARIHSHPMEPFHSEIDDANPALTYEGALSIVAPFFGLGLRHGLDLCAVYVLRSGAWSFLETGPNREGRVRVQ